ncbi:MAG: MFS transporter [Acidimicrobiales bacterium]
MSLTQSPEVPRLSDLTPIPLHEQPEIYQRRWFILGVMCSALVMVVLAVSSLNVAIPTMQQELGATASQLQWIVDSYALLFAGVLLTAGAIGDRFGRKGALLGGLGVFGTGALVAGLADSANTVIVGRSVMGIGAAFVMPATLSMINAVFPPRERARAIAIWAGFAGAGGALGPIVSGALLERFWWGSTILVNLPVIAVVAIAIARFAPRSRDDAATPLDPTGAVLSLLGLSALLFGIIEGPERGWSSGVVLGSFAAAVVLLGGFVGWERRAAHPMLPLTFFRDRRFSVGSGVITTVFFSMFGFFFLISQLLQFGRGYSALLTGVALLPMPITFIVLSPLSASIAARFGSGATIVTGFSLVAVGFGALGLIETDTPYLVMAGSLVLMAAGLGLAMAPATGNIMSAVPLGKGGVGSAVNDTTRELGGALGIAVLGSLATAGYKSAVDVGGLGLDAATAEQAEESIGAAYGIADQLGGARESLLARAGEAFTDAFAMTSVVSAVIAAAGAVIVALTFSRRKEHAAIAGAALEPGHVPTADVATGVAVAAD